MNSNGQQPTPADWDSMPEWITVDEAAQLSGYNPQHVRRLARQGQIGAEKKGRDWWIDRDKFRSYLEAMEALGPKKYDPRGTHQVNE